MSTFLKCMEFLGYGSKKLLSFMKFIGFVIGLIADAFVHGLGVVLAAFF